jgi:hypothetical protein
MRDRESLKIQMHRVRVEGKESREQDEKSRSGEAAGTKVKGESWE